MTRTQFDIEKFDGKNDFTLWQVRMKALLEKQGLATALEELPAATISAYDNVIQKKAFSILILCLGDQNKQRVWTKMMRTQFDIEKFDGKNDFTLWQVRIKALLEKQGLATALEELPAATISAYDNSEEHLKRDCPTYNHKKSQGFVRNEDHVSGFGVDGYDNVDVMMAMSVEELLDWIIDSGGSYHITYKKDYLVDFKKYDGGNVQLGDGRKCRVRGTEGFTMKMKSGKIKAIKCSLVVLSRTRRANCIYTLDGQVVTRKTLKGRKQLGEYQTGRRSRRNRLVEETNMTLLAKDMLFSDSVWYVQGFLGRGTTMSTYLVNMSPSSVIELKTPLDMLGFFGWLASIKQGMLEPVKEIQENFHWFWCRYGFSSVLQGVEFEVEPQEDQTFEVEPHRNFDHVAGSQEVQTQDLIYYHLARDREQYSTHKLFSYREHSNEAAFAVAEAEKIYAHESLNFNNTIAYEVISKWKVGLKDDMNARSHVYVLSNGCKKCNDDIDGYYWEYTPTKGNVLGMEIVKDQCGNTMRVSRSRFYNGKLVQALLEGHFILSLEGSLSRDCDVKKMNSQEYIGGYGGGLKMLEDSSTKLNFEMQGTEPKLVPTCGRATSVPRSPINAKTTRYGAAASTSTKCNRHYQKLEDLLIPLTEISLATGDFSKDSRIGDGRFGMVYIGRLSDRWKNHEAAIKRLDNTDHQGKKEFLNELRLISRFYHQNIISFIGYCDEGNEMILVYEYASNGILDHHLQDQNKRHQLPWPHRIQYALIIAKPK
nr:zinc finger, CCHC-type [Tanacetum cinerariifolium]